MIRVPLSFEFRFTVERPHDVPVNMRKRSSYHAWLHTEFNPSTAAQVISNPRTIAKLTKKQRKGLKRLHEPTLDEMLAIKGGMPPSRASIKQKG
jgi:hypothetical protein